MREKKKNGFSVKLFKGDHSLLEGTFSNNDLCINCDEVSSTIFKLLTI